MSEYVLQELPTYLLLTTANTVALIIIGMPALLMLVSDRNDRVAVA